MEINLVDSNFVGRDLSKYPGCFEWNTSNKKVSTHVFFTDNMLEKVKSLKTDQKKVAWLLEPKAISPNIYTYILENYRLFDYVLTFDKDLLSNIPNGLFAPYGTFWVEDKIDYQKQHMVSMILSFKNYTEGQQLRHNILSQRPSIVDFYGKFDSTKEIKTKNEALDNYYYSIAVENSIQDSYWTEKLLDCFITKTIPIYYGTRDVSNFFNSKGIIFFDSIKQLDVILNKITPEIYNERKIYIEENYNLAKKYKEPEYYIFENYPYLIT